MTFRADALSGTGDIHDTVNALIEKGLPDPAGTTRFELPPGEAFEEITASRRTEDGLTLVAELACRSSFEVDPADPELATADGMVVEEIGNRITVREAVWKRVGDTPPETVIGSEFIKPAGEVAMADFLLGQARRLSADASVRSDDEWQRPLADIMDSLVLRSDLKTAYTEALRILEPVTAVDGPLTATTVTVGDPEGSHASLTRQYNPTLPGTERYVLETYDPGKVDESGDPAVVEIASGYWPHRPADDQNIDGSNYALPSPLYETPAAGQWHDRDLVQAGSQLDPSGEHRAHHGLDYQAARRQIDAFRGLIK